MGKESIKSHEDLVVYQMAFEAAMKIFKLSKTFPVEERYSLTDPSGSQSLMGETPALDSSFKSVKPPNGLSRQTALSHQIRRSSRSVCANLAEAWRKRRYEAAVLVRVPLRLSPTRGRTALLLNLAIVKQRRASTQVWLKFAVKCHDERVPLRLTPTRDRSSIFGCRTRKRTLRNLQSSP